MRTPLPKHGVVAPRNRSVAPGTGFLRQLKSLSVRSRKNGNSASKTCHGMKLHGRMAFRRGRRWLPQGGTAGGGQPSSGEAPLRTRHYGRRAALPLAPHRRPRRLQKPVKPWRPHNGRPGHRIATSTVTRPGPAANCEEPAADTGVPSTETVVTSYYRSMQHGSTLVAWVR